MATERNLFGELPFLIVQESFYAIKMLCKEKQDLGLVEAQFSLPSS